MVLDLLGVKLLSPKNFGDSPDMTEIIKSVEKSLLCNNHGSNIFTEAMSITDSLEDLESFAGTAVEPGF